MAFDNAAAYDRFMGRWSRLVAPLLVDFADISDAERVVDIGSGTGSLSFEIAGRKPGRHVTAIDPSGEFVAFASSKNPFPDRIHFQVGDAQQLPFANATYAAVLSLLVFNFISDAEKALREAHRVTHPGGRIAAAVWDYGGIMRMLRAFWDAAAGTDPRAEKFDEKQMPLCRAGELSALWKKADLEDVHEQSLDITMTFDSFMDYWDPFLLGQGPAGAYIRSLAADRVDVLRSAVKRELSINSETDAFALPARVWAVRGTVPRR